MDKCHHSIYVIILLVIFVTGGKQSQLFEFGLDIDNHPYLALLTSKSV